VKRREFLIAGAGAFALRAAAPEGWSAVSRILHRIQPPEFPKHDYDATKYGVVADGITNNAFALNRAIDDCSRKGGGRVIVPKGDYATAAVVLKSNVNLHLMLGATLHFVRDPKLYPLVLSRWEGTECMNYSSFLYAYGQENIAITGDGILDGNCDCEHWWPWKGRTNCGWTKGDPWQDDARNKLMAMGERDVPVKDRIFGERSFLRPDFFQPVRCKNLLVDGVTFINSPMFEVHPVYCTNVTVRNIRVISRGPNNDGCDPDSCKDVLIENCSFDTGDDCIAIKAGRNRDGRRVAVPSENIVIRNCEMKDGHGALTIGSEMSGGVRNVYAENCKLSSPNLNQAFRFKTNAMRGGTIENVYFRNIEIGEISDAILQIDFNYEEGPKGPERPVVRNIDIRDVTCRKAKYALNVRGFANAPIQNIRIEKCAFNNVASPDVVENVQGLTMNDVRVNGKLAGKA
jgi:polygalacturonase